MARKKRVCVKYKKVSVRKKARQRKTHRAKKHGSVTLKCACKRG